MVTSSMGRILAELDERYIAREVGIPHDEARLGYVLSRNTVSDFREFERIIGDYYNHHFSRSISHGGRLSPTEAVGRATTESVVLSIALIIGLDCVFAFFIY